MFASVTLTGREGGAVMWGYHLAASLTSWSLSAQGTTGRLTATVGEADDFRLAQPGLTFRVLRQTGQHWDWPLSELHIADRTLTATVSLQE